MNISARANAAASREEKYEDDLQRAARRHFCQYSLRFGPTVCLSVHYHQQGSHKDHSCHFGMTKLLLPFLDGNFSTSNPPLSYSLTSQTAHFLEGAIPARHLLHPTVTSSPSPLPTSQSHIFRSLFAFGPTSRSRHQKRSSHQQGRTTKRKYRRKQ